MGNCICISLRTNVHWLCWFMLFLNKQQWMADSDFCCSNAFSNSHVLAFYFELLCSIFIVCIIRLFRLWPSLQPRFPGNHVLIELKRLAQAIPFDCMFHFEFLFIFPLCHFISHSVFSVHPLSLLFPCERADFSPHRIRCIKTVCMSLM